MPSSILFSDLHRISGLHTGTSQTAVLTRNRRHTESTGGICVANAGTHNQVLSLAFLSHSQRKPEADSSNDADVPCTPRRKTSVDAMLWHGVGKDAEEDKVVDMLWSCGVHQKESRPLWPVTLNGSNCIQNRLTLMQRRYPISAVID
jgi:hypothetical protein